jgi:hypothetical protein
MLRKPLKKTHKDPTHPNKKSGIQQIQNRRHAFENSNNEKQSEANNNWPETTIPETTIPETTIPEERKINLRTTRKTGKLSTDFERYMQGKSNRKSTTA